MKCCEKIARKNNGQFIILFLYCFFVFFAPKIIRASPSSFFEVSLRLHYVQILWVLFWTKNI